MISPRLQRAINLASSLHRDQTRRDLNRTPYISHLFSVMLLAKSVTQDEDVLIASLLHDSLEDVQGFEKKDLEELFGERVATIVDHVTEPYIAGGEADVQIPWLERKEAYLNKVKDGPIESALVSCADKVHNLSSFIFDFKKEGEVFLKNFHGSVKNQLHFYELVLAALASKIEGNPLFMELSELHIEAKELFKDYE